MRGAAKIIIAAGTMLLGGSAWARDPLGVFGSWGAFRDTAPRRCFAIAEPDPIRTRGDWRPFASIANWPARSIRNQLHIRLRKNRAGDTAVTLSIGDQRFPLVAGRADAWAADPRADAAIVRALRSSEWMIVSAKAEKGGTFMDSYRLRGAATAIDASTIACAKR